MNKKSASVGFTLIEVLIGLSLLSMMMLFIFSSLKYGAKSWDAGETKITQTSEMATVHNFFYNQLSAALPLWDDFSEKKKQFSFKGDNNSLQFVAALPFSAGRLGLQLFEIKLKNKAIMVAIKPFYPVATGEKWNIDDVTLLNQVKKLDIAYFGSRIKGRDSTWQKKWEYRHFPELIKIRIQSVKKHYSPEIIITLKNQAAQKNITLKSNQNADELP